MHPRYTPISQAKPYKKPRRTLGTIIIGWMLTLLATIIGFIPAEILAAIYFLSGPTNFWEKFAILGLGVIMGVSFQILLLILWIISLNFIWTELCVPKSRS